MYLSTRGRILSAMCWLINTIAMSFRSLVNLKNVSSMSDVGVLLSTTKKFFSPSLLTSPIPARIKPVVESCQMYEIFPVGTHLVSDQGNERTATCLMTRHSCRVFQIGLLRVQHTSKQRCRSLTAITTADQVRAWRPRGKVAVSTATDEWLIKRLDFKAPQDVQAQDSEWVVERDAINIFAVECSRWLCWYSSIRSR